MIFYVLMCLIIHKYHNSVDINCLFSILYALLMLLESFTCWIHKFAKIVATHSMVSYHFLYLLVFDCFSMAFFRKTMLWASNSDWLLQHSKKTLSCDFRDSFLYLQSTRHYKKVTKLAWIQIKDQNIKGNWDWFQK